MNVKQADDIFGPVCFKTEGYELRAVERSDGLHVFAFRIREGKTLLPLGFMQGYNSLHFSIKE